MPVSIHPGSNAPQFVINPDGTMMLGFAQRTSRASSGEVSDVSLTQPEPGSGEFSQAQRVGIADVSARACCSALLATAAAGSCATSCIMFAACFGNPISASVAALGQGGQMALALVCGPAGAALAALSGYEACRPQRSGVAVAGGNNSTDAPEMQMMTRPPVYQAEVQLAAPPEVQVEMVAPAPVVVEEMSRSGA